MAVKMILRKKEYEVEAKGTLKDALKQLNLSPEAYLAMRNGEMITEDEVLKDGDVIQLIAVISGG